MKTSPIASVAVAFKVDEFILLPIDLLNLDNQNLKPIEISNNKKVSFQRLLE